MGSFYDDNDDLRWYVETGIDWEPVVRLTEYEWKAEDAPEGVDDAVEMYRDILDLVGTVVAVVVANLWARQTGRPTSIVLIPAIVVLVSGSIGFRGLAAMTEGEWLLGVRQFSQMFVVALTIFAGILVGYAIVRPEPSL